MLVDSHCHLDFPDFTSELAAVLARARAAGVGHFRTIGVHPHEAESEPLESPEVLLRASAHPKVVGFGETGLDFYYNHSPREAQISDFRVHIAAARDAQLPLVVHTRDAEDDTIAILREEHAKGVFPGAIHCFTGTPKLARAALEL